MIKHTVKETSIDELFEVIESIKTKKKSPSSELQEEWLFWLSESDDAGFYKRRNGMDYSARFMYMHNASPSGLLWLIQVLGINKELVQLAETDYQRVMGVSDDKQTQSAAIRKRVPWAVVDRAIAEHLLALYKAFERKHLRLQIKKEVIGW